MFTNSTTTGLYHAGSGKIGFAGVGVGMIIFDPTQIGTGVSGNILQYENGALPCPVGTVNDFAGSTAPSGWLLCYGQAILIASYPELYNVIGTSFNTGGELVTQFRVPDCRGRANVGKDNMGGSAAGRMTSAASGVDGTALGASGGAQTVTLDTTMIPAHSHGVTDPGHTHSYVTTTLSGTIFGPGSVSYPTAVGGTTGSATTGITIQNTGGGLAHNNTQPTIIFNKIIFAGRP